MGLLGFTQMLSLLLLASVAWGQTTGRPSSRQFMWKWKNLGIGFQIAPCIPLEIEVMPWNITLNDTFGVPPYYMQAFPLGGTPTTTFIGATNNSLSWTNTHAPGTKLLLTVVDSTGSYGGVPGDLYDVVDGVSNNCVVAEPQSPSFAITSNITLGSNLETCKQWGVEVTGGVPPYNVTIAAINSPVITNVTILNGLDAFTYVNRADPGAPLIMAVSDFTGRWAHGTAWVRTTGSTNVECTGLISQTGSAKKLKEEAEARERAANKKRTGIIVGVTVPLVLILLAAIAYGVWWYRRRQKRAKEMPTDSVEPYSYHEEPLTLPSSFYGNPAGYTPVSKAALASSQVVTTGGSPTGRHSQTGGLSYTTAPSGAGSPSIHGSFSHSSAFTSSENHNAAAAAAAGVIRPRPSFSTFPVRPSTSKSQEAAQGPVILSPDSEYTSAGTSTQHASGSAPGEEIIIQHRDGGTVRELPPPYADRSRLAE